MLKACCRLRIPDATQDTHTHTDIPSPHMLLCCIHPIAWTMNNLLSQEARGENTLDVMPKTKVCFMFFKTAVPKVPANIRVSKAQRDFFLNQVVVCQVAVTDRLKLYELWGFCVWIVFHRWSNKTLWIQDWPLFIWKFESHANYQNFLEESIRLEGAGRRPRNTGETQEKLECW